MSASQSIGFVCKEFFDPTIDHPECDEKARNIAVNFRVWARSFTHTGNLFDFLRFLQKSADTTVFSSQSKLGLATIDDAVRAFEIRFRSELDDRLDLDSLQVGETYSTHLIHAICGNYDVRSGGILPVFREDGTADFVAIKATLSGGDYPNEWLNDGKRLKYFMKSISGNFKETYQDNAAIINNPQNPVLAFVRNTKKENFTFRGRFFPFAVHTDISGAKWFELVEWSNGLSNLQTVDAANSLLAGQVQKSQRLDPVARQLRLAGAPTQPKKQRAITTVFKRNPDVIAEVLFRANGICEGCHETAPFERKADGTPYLEVHHKLPLSKGGPDTVENAVALCPNCHRREHFGLAIWPC
jgi:5-methylcytosine-specific restriction protein A